MDFILFLDDLRQVEEIVPEKERHLVKVARTFDEATELVKLFGIPDFVYFDNDLGEDLEGYDFAKWMVEQSMDGKFFFPETFGFHVHSANSQAWDNIKFYLDNYLTKELNRKLKKDKYVK